MGDDFRFAYLHRAAAPALLPLGSRVIVFGPGCTFFLSVDDSVRWQRPHTVPRTLGGMLGCVSRLTRPPIGFVISMSFDALLIHRFLGPGS